MESALKVMAENAGLALELIVVIVVLVGAVRAFVRIGIRLVAGTLTTPVARLIWIDFATVILFALEFALGADIIETAVAPTWDEIGQLAAIAAIRTGLGFFLSRDIEEFGRPEPREAEA